MIHPLSLSIFLLFSSFIRENDTTHFRSFSQIPAVLGLVSFLLDLCFCGLQIEYHKMAEVDLKAESVNGYIKEFLQEIDHRFLDPEFST